MTNSTIVVAAVSLLLGGAAGWFAAASTSQGSEPALTSEQDTAAGVPEEVTLKADAGFARSRITELETQLQAANVERDELKKIVAQAGLTEKSVPDEAGRIARAAELDGPRFVYKGMEAALKEMKWKTIAKSVVGMGPLMQDLGNALANGKPAGDLPMQIQKYNVPLIQAAVAASQGGMAGYGINGAFSHPALVANMVYSTLIEAGHPLDDAQVEQLSQLADRYVAEDARLRVPAGEEAFVLEQLVLESELKDRFYKAVDAMLAPEQIAVLHPATLRDRTAGDIFCAGLIWMQSAQVARVSNREELTQKITAGLMRRLQMAGEDKDVVGRAVGDWAARFSDSAFTPLDALEKNNMVKMDRIRAAGKPMVELYKELVRSLPGQDEVIGRIRSSSFLVIPAGR